MRPPERPRLLQEVIHYAGRRLVLHFEVADAARQVPGSLLLAPNLEYAVTENQQARTGGDRAGFRRKRCRRENAHHRPGGTEESSLGRPRCDEERGMMSTAGPGEIAGRGAVDAVPEGEEFV